MAHCLDQVDWTKGSHWKDIAMTGKRINNTGPNIRSTAGYIVHEGGVDYPDPDKEDGDATSDPVGILVASWLKSRGGEIGSAAA